MLNLKVGDFLDFRLLSVKLIELLYERSEFDFKRGTFRIRGGHIDIYLPYEDMAIRVIEEAGRIKEFQFIDPFTGQSNGGSTQQEVSIYPAKLYLTDPVAFRNAEAQIRSDLQNEYTQ